MTRVSIRTDDDLKEEFSDYCDRNGTNMSSKLKEMMRQAVGRTEGNLPDDPELAAAYQRLYQIRKDGARITVADAEPQLANELNMPAMAVRRGILEPLDHRGYINVRAGIITLNVDLEVSDQ